MKRFLIAAVLATLPLLAQDSTPKTKYYGMQFDAAKCAEMAVYNHQPTTACQGVEVFIVTKDPTVRLYQVTISYTDADGRAGAVVRYQPAAEFRATASSATTLAWVELADVTLDRIDVVPFGTAGTAAHM